MEDGLILNPVIDSDSMNKSNLLKTAAVPLFLNILLLFSCTSENGVYLTGTGSGKADFSISLSPLIIRYSEDIAGGFTGGTGGGNIRIFDEDKLKDHISSMKGVDLVSVNSPSSDKLDFTIRFDNMEKIFPDSGILTFTNKNGLKTVTFYLDTDNFSRITSFLGLSSDEMIDTFGPQKEDPYSADEYMEIVNFLFDEYGSKEEIEAVMRKASIVTRLSVDGEITGIDADPQVASSFRGGSGRIEVPLLSFLTLSKPVSVKVTWR